MEERQEEQEGQEEREGPTEREEEKDVVHGESRSIGKHGRRLRVVVEVGVSRGREGEGAKERGLGEGRYQKWILICC